MAATKCELKNLENIFQDRVVAQWDILIPQGHTTEAFRLARTWVHQWSWIDCCASSVLNQEIMRTKAWLMFTKKYFDVVMAEKEKDLGIL